MRRLLASVIGMAAAVGVLVIPVADAQAAPGIRLTPEPVVVGGTLTISGTGCWEEGVTPDRPALVQVSVPLVTVETFPATGIDGAWSVKVQMPASHPGGTFVTAFCALPSRYIDYEKAYLRILPATLPPTPPPAPAPAPAPVPVPGPGPKPTATRAPSPSAAAPTATPAAPPSTTPPAPAAVSPGPAAGCSDCARVVPTAPLEAGERLELSYTGFQPGEQVTLVMHSTPVTLGTFTADATGTVVAAVELPEDAESGEHTLTFSGPVSGDLVVLPFRIEAAEAVAATTAVRAEAAASDDGFPTWWAAAGAAGVVLLVAGVVVALRRRRNSGDADADRGTDEVGDARSGSTEEQLA